MSSPSGSQASPYGRGSGRGSADDLPEGCGGKGGGWRPVIFVTPYGTKFPVPSSHRKEGLPEVWALPRPGEIEMKVAWVRPCDDGVHEGILNVFQVGGRA